MTATIADVLEGRARWTVLEGDCLAILPTLPPKSVAHVITDPPYSEHVHSKQRRVLSGSGGRVASGQRAGRGMVIHADLGFVALSPELRRFCGVHFPRLARRWMLVFSDIEGLDGWRGDLERAGGRHVRAGVWHRPGSMPQLTGDRPAVGCEGVQVSHVRGVRMKWNGGGLPAFWSFPSQIDRNGAGDRFHTTQKPLTLLLRMVEQFTDPGEVVLDPFAGSATTGAACLRLGRRFIGIEKDPKYAALAQERLSAESQGLTLRDARVGQLPLLGPP